MTMTHYCCVIWILIAFGLGTARGIQRLRNTKAGMFGISAGKVLKGHVISTHDVSSPFDCSLLCIGHTQCFSYDYKPKGAGDEGVCELNNATRKSDPAAFQKDSQYNHYYDLEVETFKTCLDYLRHGARENGVYTITDSSGDSYKVWCDLTSEPGSAWTLILSFARKNRRLTQFCTRSLIGDAPVNEEKPNWEAYRLSLNRMKRLASQSTHWRATTGFIVFGVDYVDYLRAKFSSFDIMSFGGGAVCKAVEYVNIRGYKGSSTQATFWQLDNTWAFHIDSGSTSCQFKANNGAVSSENNFGFYCESDPSMNTNFRGTHNEDSTTEFWFGGYI